MSRSNQERLCNFLEGNKIKSQSDMRKIGGFILRK